MLALLFFPSLYFILWTTVTYLFRVCVLVCVSMELIKNSILPGRCLCCGSGFVMYRRRPVLILQTDTMIYITVCQEETVSLF